MLSLKPWPFVQSFFDMHAPRQPNALPNNCLCPLFFLFLLLFCFFGDFAFSEYFCTIAVPSLCGECVVRFFSSGWCFLPCDHRLDFLLQLIRGYARIQSIKSINQPSEKSKLSLKTHDSSERELVKNTITAEDPILSGWTRQ